MNSILRRFSALASLIVSMAVLASSAQAVVQVTGNVWLSPDAGTGTYGGLYADNPFTTTINEGIPTNGNRIDPFRVLGNQIEFEGRPIAASNTNENFSIIVGQTSFGELIINQSQLRDMDLVIGDQGTVNGVLRNGSGVVRIEGFGALFNNDPYMLPYLGVDPSTVTPDMVSVNPRPQDVGYDLYVGRAGNGVLQLALGGRAEIQDAVIVGDRSGSVGTILIDGIDSFLQSGGFQTTASDPNEINYMIVGRLGSGTMRITNGGQSYNQGLASTTGGTPAEVFGAVVGSNMAADTTSPPSPGGQGTVIVDGEASKWTVGGTLQIGAFHSNRVGTGPLTEEDLEGNEVVYGSGVGRGTLKISNGALVSVVPPPQPVNANDLPNRLDLLIGNFGHVELDGGRFELLGAFNSTTPNNPTQQLQRGRIVNDGIISGDGSMTALQFRNRVLGQVRVGAGQKLSIEAIGNYTENDNVPMPDEQEYPLSNYGVISVLGTETARAEIEFVRNQVAPDFETATNFTRPFLNLPVTGAAAPNGRTEGLIHGEWSTMRFRSGVSNRGVMAFTAGNNVISGDVVNENETAPGAGDNGTFLIGPNTNVVFEDDFVMGGVVDVNLTGSFEVLAGNSLHVPGTLKITVTGSDSGLQFNPYQIAGNAYLTGLLNVTITNPGMLPPLSSVPILSVSGSIFGTLGVVPDPTSSLLGLDFITFAQGSNLMLQAFTPIAGMGADFNGDGVIDAIDYAIWRQNYGSAGPAGDANGDGVVDAADYTIWRNTLTPPPPGAGSGGLAGGTVPEPTSLVMLVAGSLLALAAQRRRTC